MNKKLLFLLIIFFSILSFVRLIQAQSVTDSPTPTQTQTVTPTPIFCGGFAGVLCPSNYSCIYSNGLPHAPYPDASGICVLNQGLITPTPIICGGYPEVTCPTGFECEISEVDLADAQGICVQIANVNGDTDGDGYVTYKDYFYYVSMKYKGGAPANVDVDFNNDKIINDTDRNVIVNALLLIINK